MKKTRQPTNAPNHGRRLGCALAFVTLALPGSAAADDAALAAALEQYAVRPVEPPSPASDFTLPTVAGGKASLSDARGRWVVLTFFATWCGPCASEMPSLQRLHETRRDQGVDVVGVALESDRAAVQRWLSAKGVSFPALLDGQGDVGRRYHAASIPVTYLIDPNGRIVGVARGARDWAAATPLVDTLLAQVPPDPQATSLYASGTEPVELPTNIEPPTAEVSLSSESPTVGTPFFLEVEVRWNGTFEDYLLNPPTVQLPDAVTLRGTSALTSTGAGRQVVTYRIELVAREPGAYQLDPVEVRYTPHLESAPMVTRITGPTVSVAAVTVFGLPPIGFVGGIASALVLIAAGLLLLRRRTQASAPEAAPASNGHTDLSGRLETARSCRMEGDAAGFLAALLAIEEALGIEAHEYKALTAAFERARYGGEAPNREQMDQWQRRVERHLTETAPDPNTEARQSIRMIDATE